MIIRLRPYHLAFFAAASALVAACSTIDTASPPAIPIPSDCSEPAKLFDWFSVHSKTLSWAKEGSQKEIGTLTIVFTFLNTDRLPRALSNLGTGYLYTIEYSLKGDDGTVYTATDPSGIFAGNEIHAAIEYNISKEGTLKFKVPQGNYTIIFGRKFDGKLMTKYAFSCTIIVR
jgi:hypothetical protein